ncbi:MAG: hypothetical protein HY331_00530 [Chloroflexi bacterium]|nr:hypothetical protein [Chloroflexota bacterium]
MAGSALALALAGLAKFVPFLVSPVFVRRWGPRGTVLAVAVSIGGYVPFLLAGPAVLRGTLGEATDARFNDSLHLVLERLAAPLGPAASGAVQVATAGILVGALGFTCWRWRRPEQLPGAVFFLLGLYLLLSPQVHPWYAAWILPFVAITLRPAGRRLFALDPALGWLMWSGLVALTELTYAPGFSARWWIVIRLVEYGPLIALLALQVVKRSDIMRHGLEWFSRAR